MASAKANKNQHPHIASIQKAFFENDPDFKRYHWASRMKVGDGKTVDYIFATPQDPHNPKDIFTKIRWGGQFVFVSPNRREVEQLCEQFPKEGFEIDRKPEVFKSGGFLFLKKKLWFFVARKVRIIAPGDFTERFTYHVYLEKTSQGYVVGKEIPNLESMRERLARKFPDADDDFVDQRARKLIETIFPVFLTREAAFLKILQKHLPEPYNKRVPEVIDLEKDEGGFVKKFQLRWLRKAVQTMDQIEFCRQSADMLRQLHERARIIHLDLRLDNFVITEDGVGFVDYGSAARVGENIGQSPFLKNLFGEIMKTSQIQRMLGKMQSSGLLTSEFITSSHHKVDKAVDLFYLAVQMENPHSNPDIKELVDYDANSKEARMISQLTAKVLRPDDPKNPVYTSARDVLRALEEIADRLEKG